MPLRRSQGSRLPKGLFDCTRPLAHAPRPGSLRGASFGARSSRIAALRPALQVVKGRLELPRPLLITIAVTCTDGEGQDLGRARAVVRLEELLRPRQRVELLSPMMALSFFRARCFKTSPRKNEDILEEENYCLITH